MTQYPDETTRRHLLALEMAGHIKAGSPRQQMVEVVDKFRLVMEAAEGSETVNPCKHGHWMVDPCSGGKRCLTCGETL